MDPPNKRSLKNNEIIGRKYHHYGSMYPDDQLIVICRDQTDQAKKESIIHECGHAIFEFCHLRAELKGGARTEEKVVQALGNALMMLMDDNPKLLALFGK